MIVDSNNNGKKALSSVLNKIRQIPSLPANALNNFENSDFVGVYEVSVPHSFGEEMLIAEGRGCFSFGGFITTSSSVAVSRIIIDDKEVFNSVIAGKRLNKLFATGSDIREQIASNVPAFLVSANIKIYGYSDISGNWWKPHKNNILYLALVALD